MAPGNDTRILLDPSKIQGDNFASWVSRDAPILLASENNSTTITTVATTTGVSTIPTTTTRKPPDDDSLTMDEILACVAILTILGLIAGCLVYFCIRKYCCRPRQTLLGASPHLEGSTQSSLTSSSLNHNELPSIQRAVDGSHSLPSTGKEPVVPASSVSPDRTPARRTRPPRTRSASPSQRAVALEPVETVRSPNTRVRRGSTYQAQKKRLARMSQLTTHDSLVGARTAHPSQQHQQPQQIHQQPAAQQPQHQVRQQQQPRRPQAVEAAIPVAQTTERSPGNAADTQSQGTLRVKSVAKSQILQDIPQRSSLPTVHVDDVPITADLILKQSKDTKREYSLFKSPHLYE